MVTIGQKQEEETNINNMLLVYFELASPPVLSGVIFVDCWAFWNLEAYIHHSVALFLCFADSDQISSWSTP